ncbi:Conjugation TrbI family protein (plasmid) [Pararobbsia alpina]|uniref:TrbI/VirB10 family protein n=1 Tax=Pararobbsia alpina TaxID=621374 RepID=UPI0039A6386A
MSTTPEDPKAALRRGKIPRNIIFGVGAIAAAVIGILGFHYQVQSEAKAQADAEAKKAAQIQPASAVPDVRNDLEQQIKAQEAQARDEAARAQRDQENANGENQGVKPALTAGDFQPQLGKDGHVEQLAKDNEQDNIFTSGFFAQRGKSSGNYSRGPASPADDIPDPMAALAKGQVAAQQQLDAARALAGAAPNEQPTAAGNSARREQFLSSASKQSLPDSTGITAQLPKCTVPMGFRVKVESNDALDSDLPGDGTATVAENIYGGQRGECLAIPQGTQLYFKYSGDIAVGQESIQVAGVRLTLPNHKIVPLLGMQGGDPNGYTGVSGDVNNHFLKIFGTSLFIAVLEHRFDNSTTAQTVGPNGVTSYGTTAGQVAAQTSQTVMQRNLQIPPTITTKQAQVFYLRLNRDITMEPYVE